MGKNQHVVPHDGKWAVRPERANRVGSVHDKKSEAMDVARDRAIREKSERVEHGRDGKIMDKDSFGKDPCPPRDTKH